MNKLSSLDKLIIYGLKRIKSPKYIILFVNESCPNNCLHCWFKPQPKALKEEYLRLENYIKLAKDAGNISFLSITGGEAFLREDLLDIIEGFERNCHVSRLDIPSSGFDSEYIAKYAESILNMRKGPFRIDISIDGDESTHDYIRGREGSFKEAVKTVQELKKLREKHSNFDVSIITTISSYNQNKIENISNIVENILPDGEWMVNIIRPPSRDSNALDVDSANYLKASDLIMKRIKNRSYKGDKGHRLGKWLTAKNILRRDYILSYMENISEPLICSAGTYIGVISATGNVYACENKLQSIGNIKNKSIVEVWRSQERESNLDSIYNSCRSCTHECFLSSSLLLNPKFFPKLLMNRLKL